MLYQGMSRFETSPIVGNSKAEEIETPKHRQSQDLSERVLKKAITSLQKGDFDTSVNQFQASINFYIKDWRPQFGKALTMILQSIEKDKTINLKVQALDLIEKSIDLYEQTPNVNPIEDFIIGFFNLNSLQFGLEILDCLVNSTHYDAIILICNDLLSLDFNENLFKKDAEKNIKQNEIPYEQVIKDLIELKNLALSNKEIYLQNLATELENDTL
jgi:hypothetical protein